MSYAPTQRPAAPQHSLDWNYEATRPQYWESLYEWATTDYFDMNQASYPNPMTLITCELKVKPKTEKFMLTCKVADQDCLQCAQINQTRHPGQPKIPCLVSGVDSRCALCIVTKKPKSSCQSQLPASYPWPQNAWRRSHPPVIPLARPSPTVPTPSTSPSWTLDLTGDAVLRKQVEIHKENVPRRSESPVRHARYYNQEAPKGDSAMLAQRKRRQSISGIDVSESEKRQTYERASIIQPEPHGDDSYLREVGKRIHDDQQNTSMPMVTNSTLQSSPQKDMDTDMTPPAGNDDANNNTPSRLVIDDLSHHPVSPSSSNTLSAGKTSIGSNDSRNGTSPESLAEANDKASLHAQFFDKFLGDYRKNEEKNKKLGNMVREEKEKSKNLQDENDLLRLELQRAQENIQSAALLRIENQRLQDKINKSNKSFAILKARITECLGQ